MCDCKANIEAQLTERFKANIERMAREAGFPFNKYGTLQGPDEEGFDADDMLARFAALVAAAERERCAKVCKEMAERMERAAQICADNGEADEVSPLRSTAWQLTVAAGLIEKERSS